MTLHRHQVQIYYEDTDHSGAVYHANYLKYFERAREHALGVETLRRLLEDDGIGFVVYRAELTFRQPARFADTLEVRTRGEKRSEFRLHFTQDVFRGEELLVGGAVEMVCLDRQGQLVKVPGAVLEVL